MLVCAHRYVDGVCQILQALHGMMSARSGSVRAASASPGTSNEAAMVTPRPLSTLGNSTGLGQEWSTEHRKACWPDEPRSQCVSFNKFLPLAYCYVAKTYFETIRMTSVCTRKTPHGPGPVSDVDAIYKQLQHYRSILKAQCCHRPWCPSALSCPVLVETLSVIIRRSGISILT
jgi:hypothetical protein